MPSSLLPHARPVSPLSGLSADARAADGAVTPHTVLVLGGGGMKGMAHIGVWRALTAAGILPDAIVGTSIGALMGAFIASGWDAARMTALAEGITQADILKLNRRALWFAGIKQPSLFAGEHYRAWVDRVLPVSTWATLTRPLRINALSLTTGEEQWFGTGGDTTLSVPDAVYASCALPLYFPPLVHGADVLVDGGLRNVVGIAEALRWGARRLIVVDVSGEFLPPAADWLTNGLAAIHDRVVGVLAERQRAELHALAATVPTLLVRPAVGHLPAFDFTITPQLIAAGEAATVAALEAPASAAFHAAACTPDQDNRESVGPATRVGQWLGELPRALPRTLRRITDGLTDVLTAGDAGEDVPPTRE